MIIKNFLFHRVNPVRDLLWDPMDVGLFDQCIKYLKKNYHVISLEKNLFSGELIKTKKKLATVMFDDGYVDNIQYAVPVLEKHDCPASFYVVTGCIDHNLPTWTHIVEHLFLYTNKLEINVETDSLPPSLKKNKWVDKNERIEFAKQMNPYLKNLTHENRSSVIMKLQKYFNDVELPKIMMSWKEVKQLNDAGFSIGSHSSSHAMLGTVADDNEVSNLHDQASGRSGNNRLIYFDRFFIAKVDLRFWFQQQHSQSGKSQLFQFGLLKRAKLRIDNAHIKFASISLHRAFGTRNMYA
ncbi:MAG: polysaccharide deacetylase family protein, partial [Bacteroidota bacterium]